MNRCGSFWNELASLPGSRPQARRSPAVPLSGGVCSSPSVLREPWLTGTTRDSRRAAASPTWLALLTRMLTTNLDGPGST
jgi:hypothetical protein